MEPKIGDKMKVSPQLTAQADWIDGEVIDVEHNPFTGLVISIKDKLGRIFFGQSRYFIAFRYLDQVRVGCIADFCQAVEKIQITFHGC